jgi:nudix-type nucleoside diphosphatase (YffH/AdpP family)
MKVDVEAKRRLLDGFFVVDELSLRFEKFDGQMSPVVKRLVLDRGDAVAALVCNTTTGRLLFVNQFRAPTMAKGPGWVTEVVAGMVDADETPEAAVRREIMEEIGFAVVKLEPISTFYVSPGGSTERIFLYYAEVDDAGKVQAGGGVVAEDEDLQLIELEPAAALREVEAGKIVDAKTILALFWLRLRAGATTGKNVKTATPPRS